MGVEIRSVRSAVGHGGRSGSIRVTSCLCAHRPPEWHQYLYSYNRAGWLTDQTSTAGQNLHFDSFANGGAGA